MPWHNEEKFINAVLSHVRFLPDHSMIRDELEAHIEDRIEEMKETESDMTLIKEKALESMGDPKEIGKALNKVHNPIIGWLYTASNAVLLIMVVILVNILVHQSSNLFSGLKDPLDFMQVDEIRYELKLEEKARIDHRIIEITGIRYSEAEEMVLAWKSYSSDLFHRNLWSMDYIGEIKDDLGNVYMPTNLTGAGSGSTRLYALMIDRFHPDARMLIITYDRYNRFYEFRIPLMEESI